MGVGPIWKDYSTPTQSNILDMYQKIADFGEILIVQGTWRDSYSDAGTVPQSIEPYMMMAPTFGYVPYVGINFFNEKLGVVTTYLDPFSDTGGVWLNNTTTQNNYTALVFNILNTYHPKYLALGIEVNTYWEYNPSDFDAFVSYYKSLYTVIKSDPDYQDTKVFVTFQLEKLKAKGLTGAEDWTPFNKFAGYLDLAAFTTYPELLYTDPSQIPKTYYSELPVKGNFTIPVAFTEIGWTAVGASQELQQAAFIDDFFQLTSGINMEFVNWAFMHDLDTDGPLTKIGLYTSDGVAKTGLSHWTAHRRLVVKR